MKESRVSRVGRKVFKKNSGVGGEWLKKRSGRKRRRQWRREKKIEGKEVTSKG